MKVTTIGVDLAKSVFLVHGVDERGHIAVRKAAAAVIVGSPYQVVANFDTWSSNTSGANVSMAQPLAMT